MVQHITGIVPFAGIDQVTLTQWTRTFAVNGNGAFLMAKAFLDPR